jgi:ATP-dependent Clp protease protease subunit
VAEPEGTFPGNDAFAATSPGKEQSPLFLMDQRAIYLRGPITDETLQQVATALMVMDGRDSAKPIKLFIDSPGGSVAAGLGIYNVMRAIDAPVWTICTSRAFSMASFLLMAGEPGHRYMLPDAKVLFHHPYAPQLQGVDSVAAEEAAVELKGLDQRLEEIIIENAGQNRGKRIISEVKKARERKDPFVIGAMTALSLGVVDHVIPMRELKRIDSRLSEGPEIHPQASAGDGSPRATRTHSRPNRGVAL